MFLIWQGEGSHERFERVWDIQGAIWEFSVGECAFTQGDFLDLSRFL